MDRSQFSNTIHSKPKHKYTHIQESKTFQQQKIIQTIQMFQHTNTNNTHARKPEEKMFQTTQTTKLHIISLKVNADPKQTQPIASNPVKNETKQNKTLNFTNKC